MKKGRQSHTNDSIIEFPRKRQKNNFGIIIILAFVFIILGYFIAGNSGSSSFNSTDAVNTETILLSNANNYIFHGYKEGYIFAKDGKISCYNTNNSMQWEQSGSKTAPSIVTGGNYVLTYYPSDTLAVITNGKKTQKIKTKGNVLQGFVNENGYCVLMLQETGLKNKIVVYDNDGKMIYYRDNPTNYITYAGLSNDNKTMITTELIAQEDGVSSELIFTNIQKNSEKARIVFENDIPGGCIFTGNNEIVVIFETKMMCCNFKGKIKWETNFEKKRVSKYSYDKGTFAFLFNEDDSADVGSEIIFYSKNGRQVGEFETEEKVYDIELKDKSVLLFMSRRLAVSNLKGKIIAYSDLTYDIKEVIFMGNKKCALVVTNTQTARLLPLK